MLVAVKNGTVTLYNTDCSSTTYQAGQAFVDPGTDHVHIMRNDSPDSPAELVVTGIIPVESQFRIDEPAPANCF